jgi:SAM-dependent methyltransferase
LDRLQRHEIAEASHRILNPFTEAKLMLLGEVCRLQPGYRQLDLACGKGEMLCRWSERYGIGGLGVDISDVFIPAARARAVELGVEDRVRFELADAATFQTQGERYNVVSCIGATWIGGGLVGTIELMKQSTTDDALLLVGEPYWTEQPPAEAFDSLPFTRDEFTTLVETLDRVQSAGVELVEMVLADGDSWDRYSAAQWWNVHAWLRANPDSPDVEEMRRFLHDSRRSHLEYQRRYLGWGVFVLRLG